MKLEWNQKYREMRLKEDPLFKYHLFFDHALDVLGELVDEHDALTNEYRAHDKQEVLKNAYETMNDVLLQLDRLISIEESNPDVTPENLEKRSHEKWIR